MRLVLYTADLNERKTLTVNLEQKLVPPHFQVGQVIRGISRFQKV